MCFKAIFVKHSILCECVMSLLQSLILKSFKKIYKTKFKVYYMCITIFTSCFDIPEFSKNKKKSYFFFLTAFNMLMEFRNFKKNSAFLEMIAVVHDIIIAFLILIKLF